MPDSFRHARRHTSGSLSWVGILCASVRVSRPVRWIPVMKFEDQGYPMLLPNECNRWVLTSTSTIQPILLQNHALDKYLTLLVIFGCVAFVAVAATTTTDPWAHVTGDENLRLTLTMGIIALLVVGYQAVQMWVQNWQQCARSGIRVPLGRRDHVSVPVMGVGRAVPRQCCLLSHSQCHLFQSFGTSSKWWQWRYSRPTLLTRQDSGPGGIVGSPGVCAHSTRPL
jgi:hypothetical protein